MTTDERLDLLVGLWRGDDLSTGYATTELALEVALITEPSTPQMLGVALSGSAGWPDWFDKNVVLMVNNAFERYLTIISVEEEFSE